MFSSALVLLLAKCMVCFGGALFLLGYVLGFLYFDFPLMWVPAAFCGFCLLLIGYGVVLAWVSGWRVADG